MKFSIIKPVFKKGNKINLWDTAGLLVITITVKHMYNIY